MRYDDMIDTVLRTQPPNAQQRLAQWSQLSDLLAQKGHDFSHHSITAALTRLSQLKASVPVEHRRLTAKTIARRCRFVPLVAFYAGDVPSVAHAMLAETTLDTQDWLALIPQTTPLARSLLRERRDLDSAVEHALHAFGPTDFRLPDHNPVSDPVAKPAILAPVAEIPAPPASFTENSVQASNPGTQISDLVRRIEAYRAEKQGGQADGVKPSVTQFIFETDLAGIVSWTDAPRRGAVIGLSIAEPAFDGAAGTDAYSAGAFRQRAAITNARLFLEASDIMGGDWRFSAQPLFDRSSGQFLGYRGNARRPRTGETATVMPGDKILGSAEFGDLMRQLVHELRTPLTGISGFAQIIDGQIFGPVPERYRKMADEIITDSDRLMAIFSDLDLAARLDSNRLAQDSGEMEVDAIIEGLADQLDRLSDERGVRLRLTITDNLPRLDVGKEHSERLIGRFLTAILAIGGNGETINGAVDFAQEHQRLRLKIERPENIRHSAEKTLLDPGFSPEGEAPDAAMLSLGFSLRLVANYAKEINGSLLIDDRALSLMLPHVASDFLQETHFQN